MRCLLLVGLCRDDAPCERARVPTRVDLLRGNEIVQVACGSFHTVCLNSKGRIYPFGRYSAVGCVA